MVSSTPLLVATLLISQIFLSAIAVDPVERSYHRPRPHPHHRPHPRPQYGLTCQQAYKRCDFRFSGRHGLPTFYVPDTADKAFTPKIVSKDYREILGILNMNNIVPEFILNGAASKITNFGSQKFTPTHFKPYQIPYSTASGVGHQVFQGDQKHVADGKCIRVYFTSYQVLDRYGKVIDNKNYVPKTANKCVVFRMRT